ncbi:uncharacterized protein I303_104609 [Kwoniella dejecticola CBS 10117]|uniref:Spermidine synthase n=1 Tax=Kwoniella dejecticola CBS 10117 TaxID=1296121 RepID=A0A1A6A4U6_9TREE|nr:uncharacterized protein I303_04413 [Kwoniella dejecticola CBS 10117]OBR85082.1 hypothetical protein I303_04413 [Kwoniella dejecticola CBS 10117]
MSTDKVASHTLDSPVSPHNPSRSASFTPATTSSSTITYTDSIDTGPEQSESASDLTGTEPDSAFPPAADPEHHRTASVHVKKHSIRGTPTAEVSEDGSDSVSSSKSAEDTGESDGSPSGDDTDISTSDTGSVGSVARHEEDSSDRRDNHRQSEQDKASRGISASINLPESRSSRTGSSNGKVDELAERRKSSQRNKSLREFSSEDTAVGSDQVKVARTETEYSDSQAEGEDSPVVERRKSSRNRKHDMIRLISLYLVPVLLGVPTALLLSLNTQLLTPLYNSIPLSLHTTPLHAGFAILSALIYWYITSESPSSSPTDIISARICLGLAALGGDVVAVYGRRIGSMAGSLLGAEYGALASRAILGIEIVGGATFFALLCFNHISPVRPPANNGDRSRNLGSILYRAAFYIFHIYTFERFWNTYLSNNLTILNRNPEKTILFISLILTTLSLFLKSSNSSTPFPTRVDHLITRSLKLKPETAKRTSRITKNVLPRQAFPLLLLLRIPLLILALRQQVFLRPPSTSHQPYVTANGDLRVISSERSITGQIVVAENLKDGYRFLRCDHSILGGRWIREVEDKSRSDGKRVDMGDSIFATFNLQEIVVLAHRSDSSESLIRTLQLTTDLQVSLEDEGDDEEEEKVPERALIIGLGAGIAASTFSRRGMYVDIVEIDPAVYLAAHKHFGLSSHAITSTNIMDGSVFITRLAEMRRDDSTDPQTIPEWDYVVQDCFTGGSVPGEMFTREFWEDLGDLVKDDGIIAMNFAGVLKSKASKAVLVTLTSVFPQCRAFGDGFEVNQGPDDLVNMVVLCTKTHSPLLTFRKPTPMDGLKSPLRSHVYSTFHTNEIRLDGIIDEDDLANPLYDLERGKAGGELNKWQVGSSLATWRAMQTILTPEMWLAW